MPFFKSCNSNLLNPWRLLPIDCADIHRHCWYIMAPPLLTLTDVNMSFGGQALLESASLSIGEQDKICLIGRNGSGKSTLLKIAAGIIHPDHGSRFVQPGVNIYYLPQEPDLDGFSSVEAYILSALGENHDIHGARLLLQELGLDPERKPEDLSGGEQKKAALVRMFASEPDIVLMDEPTNHLDMPTIEWLEMRIRQQKLAFVVISHDRRFLANLSRMVIWLDRGRCREYQKGFEGFEDWRDKVLEEEALQAHKLKRKIAREEQWVIHGVSGRRKRNVRRLKELSHLKQESSQRRKVTGGVNFTVNDGESSGKLVAKLFNLSFSYGEHTIIRDFSAIINRGDRVGIVGPNGAGKTTLVRLIVGDLNPDAGKIKRGVGIELLFIDQMRETLDPDWTLKDAISDGTGDMVQVGDEQKHVMRYVQDYLFLPEQAGTPISVLSGGERARLTLARGFRHPSNFLVLDEPTNDLDLETLDLLQEKIAEYEGAVLLVSHDRDFIDRTCNTIIVAEGGGRWVQYAGGYSDMLAQRDGLEGADIASPKKKKSKNIDKSGRRPDPGHEANSATGPRFGFAEQHELKKLPEEIERLEFEINKLKSALANPTLYSENPKKFDAWAKALTEREQLLAQKEMRWLELETLAEQSG